MPDELVSQLSLIDEMLDNMNIPVIKACFEADDIMGTIGKVASAKGLITYLVSGDKDLMQLVSDKVKLYTQPVDLVQLKYIMKLTYLTNGVLCQIK